MTKTHWKKLTNPNYIGAYSLEEGQELIVTIEKVVREMVIGSDGKEGECTVAYLKGQKPFILNKTNQKTIEKIYNTPYIEDWIGKSITLYVSKVKVGRDMVDALRVRDKAPTKPALTPTHAKWAGAIKALKAGNTTIEAIKQSFELSAQDEATLVKEGASNE